MVFSIFRVPLCVLFFSFNLILFILFFCFIYCLFNFPHFHKALSLPCRAPCSSGPAALAKRDFSAGPYIKAVRS